MSADSTEVVPAPSLAARAIDPDADVLRVQGLVKSFGVCAPSTA